MRNNATEDAVGATGSFGPGSVSGVSTPSPSATPWGSSKERVVGGRGLPEAELAGGGGAVGASAGLGRAHAAARSGDIVAIAHPRRLPHVARSGERRIPGTLPAAVDGVERAARYIQVAR